MRCTILTQHQTKTKAKKRYLKAKKDRRKKRKPAAVPSGSRTEDATHDQDSEGEDEEDSAAEVTSSPAGSVHAVDAEPESTHRPKKRRKLSPPAEDENPEVKSTASAEDDQIGLSPTTNVARLPSAPVTLPSFPLPSHPDAPSKATLALQGLDKAIIEAELIEPRRTMPIQSTDAGEAALGLSERTKKRLQELGITELFAGMSPRFIVCHMPLRYWIVQTAVVPFLLSNTKHRRLYLPYNPSQDVCVSAPTGSGKTLAYVLPIVEVSRQSPGFYRRS